MSTHHAVPGHIHGRERIRHRNVVQIQFHTLAVKSPLRVNVNHPSGHDRSREASGHQFGNILAENHPPLRVDTTPGQTQRTAAPPSCFRICCLENHPEREHYIRRQDLRIYIAGQINRFIQRNPQSGTLKHARAAPFSGTFVHRQVQHIRHHAGMRLLPLLAKSFAMNLYMPLTFRRLQIPDPAGAEGAAAIQLSQRFKIILV